MELSYKEDLLQRYLVNHLKLKFSSYRHLYQENKQEYIVQQLDDKQQEHFQHVLIPL
jgi:hypothetical protein